MSDRCDSEAPDDFIFCNLKLGHRGPCSWEEPELLSFLRLALGTIRCTEHVYPPIPTRNFDWMAYDDDTYCGCDECHSLVGRGPTEQEAITDLLEQYSEEQWDHAFAMLKDSCDEMSATVREGSKLLAEAREGLSKKLREMSVSGDFAQVSCGTVDGHGFTTLKHGKAGGEKEGFACGSLPEAESQILRSGYQAPPAGNDAAVSEAERKHHCTQHRLTQEAAERWPEEVEDVD